MSLQEKKEKQYWFQMLFTGVILGAGTLFVLLLFVPKSIQIFESFFSRVDEVCGCMNHFTFINHPYLFPFILFITFFAAVIVCLGILRVLMSFIQTKKMIKRYDALSSVSEKLSYAAQKCELLGRVRAIRSPQAILFCAGYMKPSIYVSSRIIELLSEQELIAALLHERYHMETFDPVKRAIAGVIRCTYFFIPGIRKMEKEYCVLNELNADAFVMEKMGERNTLARALYKVLQIKSDHPDHAHSFSMAFFAHPMEERIHQLSNEEYVVSLSSKKVWLYALMVIIASMFFLLMNIPQQFAAASSHDVSNCSLKEQKEITQCVSHDLSCSQEETSEYLQCIKH